MLGRIGWMACVWAIVLAAPALAQTPAPEQVNGSGTVLATTYNISMSGGPYGQDPTGTLTLNGAFNLSASATCMNVDDQGAVVGFRIDTGSMAGQGVLAGPETLPEVAVPPGSPTPVSSGGSSGSTAGGSSGSTAGGSSGSTSGAPTIFYAFLPRPPTACPPPGSPPPDSSSSGTLQGTLNRSGGPSAPVVFQHATFPAPDAGALAQAADGSIWFLEPGTDQIAVTGDDSSGAISEFPVPTANAGLAGIAPDTSAACTELGCTSGGMWFTEASAGKLGHVDRTGTVTEYTPSDPGADPSAIAADPATGGAWFTEPGADRIGHVAPGGTIAEYDLPTAAADPVAIAGDGGGGAWFVERAANMVGHVDASGTIREYPLNENGSPNAIATDPNGPGALFTEPATNQIGHIYQSGTIQSYSVPTVAAGLTAIASGPGPDGSSGAWFAEPAANQIGFVSSSGQFSEFTVPGVQPEQIAYVDALGVPPLSGYATSAAVWFTDPATGTVGFARIPRSSSATNGGSGGGGGGVPCTRCPHLLHHHHGPAHHPLALLGAPTIRHGVLTVRLLCQRSSRCRGRLIALGTGNLPLATVRVRLRAGHSRTYRLRLGARRAGAVKSVAARMGSYETAALIPPRRR